MKIDSTRADRSREPKTDHDAFVLGVATERLQRVTEEIQFAPLHGHLNDVEAAFDARVGVVEEGLVALRLEDFLGSGIEKLKKLVAGILGQPVSLALIQVAAEYQLQVSGLMQEISSRLDQLSLVQFDIAIFLAQTETNIHLASFAGNAPGELSQSHAARAMPHVAIDTARTAALTVHQAKGDGLYEAAFDERFRSSLEVILDSLTQEISTPGSVGLENVRAKILAFLNEFGSMYSTRTSE